LLISTAPMPIAMAESHLTSGVTAA
jgi:hypothetical protein